MVTKSKEDTNTKVKVEETNDECKIVIINKLYNERYNILFMLLLVGYKHNKTTKN
jgi:hypothetical protein